MQNKETEFSTDLQHLAQEKIFNLMNFEIVIDKIRSYVSEVCNNAIRCSDPH